MERDFRSGVGTGGTVGAAVGAPLGAAVGARVGVAVGAFVAVPVAFVAFACVAFAPDAAPAAPAGARSAIRTKRDRIGPRTSARRARVGGAMAGQPLAQRQIELEEAACRQRPRPPRCAPLQTRRAATTRRGLGLE